MTLTPVEESIYLRGIALDLKESFKRVAGTSRIEVLGGYPNSMEIQLNPDTLSAYSLDAATVIGMIRSEFGTRSVGMIDKDTKKILVDISQSNLESLQIPLADGKSTIALSQIANIGQ